VALAIDSRFDGRRWTGDPAAELGRAGQTL